MSAGSYACTASASMTSSAERTCAAVAPREPTTASKAEFSDADAAAVASAMRAKSWTRSGCRTSSANGASITRRPISSPSASSAGTNTHPRAPASREPVRAVIPTPTRRFRRIASTSAKKAAAFDAVSKRLFAKPPPEDPAASAVLSASLLLWPPFLWPASSAPSGRARRAGRPVRAQRRNVSRNANESSRNPNRWIPSSSTARFASASSFCVTTAFLSPTFMNFLESASRSTYAPTAVFTNTVSQCTKERSRQCTFTGLGRFAAANGAYKETAIFSPLSEPNRNATLLTLRMRRVLARNARVTESRPNPPFEA
mmetsp:Transcript_9111/g.38598  ORF Transcript_9111/g.38598 Transcript_9111/m.38598 type:complete len:314 (+) Transcript_9111:578-1519(+)